MYKMEATKPRACNFQSLVSKPDLQPTVPSKF
jgi:hypothetical protein